MKIAVTGANGFISKNLISKLSFEKITKIYKITRFTTKSNLKKIIINSDIIYHLAGVNKPSINKTFKKDNEKLTRYICDVVLKNKLKKKIIFSSSTQVLKNTVYGKSKKKCEEILEKLKRNNGSKIIILRLPNIFGKWCKPNYNSVVSTFCYKISRNQKVELFNSNSKINLLYIDDLVKMLISFTRSKKFSNSIIKNFSFTNKIVVKNLYKKILEIDQNRRDLFIPNFKDKFSKNLYSTYISLIPKKKFTYKLNPIKDERGSFIEVLKTKNAGQISLIIAKKNKIRGHHFHHSKVEKFLVIKGEAIFKMTNIIDKKEVLYKLNGDNPLIVETIPGWQHYIKNNGSTDLHVLLWSNEVFNVKKPDTYKVKI